MNCTGVFSLRKEDCFLEDFDGVFFFFFARCWGYGMSCSRSDLGLEDGRGLGCPAAQACMVCIYTGPRGRLGKAHCVG
ncbi:hypothetical protein CGRA01v4_00405 [Colletotrichum graminicola]|nr:hypothetical protein CGRA01v4_00405 [Colletotrichum graminicola]